VFTEYGVASSGSQPYEIVTGPDGALWFTQFGSNQIGRMTTTGLLVEYTVTTANSEPAGLTVGPDDNIWFAEYNADKIGTALTGGPVTAVLSITKTHAGNFTPGQQSATYNVTVSNFAGAGTTTGTVTVTETMPPDLTLVSMAGIGWTCPSAGTTCTRSDSLPSGSSYPPIVVTVNVAANTAEVVNQVSVSAVGLPASYATDPTVIGAYSPCDVNQSASTNVADVQQEINEALGLVAALNDLNGDGVVNVVDVEMVIAAVLGLGCM
jgi:hypothetical protein